MRVFISIFMFFNLLFANPNNVKTPREYYALAKTYESNFEYDKAIHEYQKGIDIELKTSPEDSSGFSFVYEAIGSAYELNGEYNNAIKYYKKALKTLSKSKKTPFTAMYHYDLGQAYRGNGEYDKAIREYEKSIKILKDIGKNKNKVFIKTISEKLEFTQELFAVSKKGVNVKSSKRYYDLARAYENKQKYQKAIENYKRALEIDLGNFGKNHKQIFLYYTVLANGYINIKDYDKAINSLENALVVARNIFKSGDKHIISTEKNLQTLKTMKHFL